MAGNVSGGSVDYHHPDGDSGGQAGRQARGPAVMPGGGPAALLAAELDQGRVRIARLEADLAHMIATSADSNADDEHDPEGATIAFERQQLQAVLDNARRTQDQLDAATEQAKAGRYGICENCGQAIAPARLEARPQSTRCITCA